MGQNKLHSVSFSDSYRAIKFKACITLLIKLLFSFSRLYSNSQHKPRYNLLFVVAGGGNLNYFGTKYFIEDMIEDSGS